MLNETIVNSIIYGFLTVFSFGLWIISIFTYQKSKNKKILFVNIVFLLYLIKGLLLSLSILFNGFLDFLTIPVLAVFDLLILVLLFIAILKTQ